MPASFCTTAHTPARTPSSGRIVGLLAKFDLALTAHAHRMQLAELDETRLADIGVTQNEAKTEAARPFWDVPGHWLR